MANIERNWLTQRGQDFGRERTERMDRPEDRDRRLLIAEGGRNARHQDQMVANALRTAGAQFNNVRTTAYRELHDRMDAHKRGDKAAEPFPYTDRDKLLIGSLENDLKTGLGLDFRHFTPHGSWDYDREGQPVHRPGALPLRPEMSVPRGAPAAAATPPAAAAPAPAPAQRVVVPPKAGEERKGSDGKMYIHDGRGWKLKT